MKKYSVPKVNVAMFDKEIVVTIAGETPNYVSGLAPVSDANKAQINVSERTVLTQFIF